MLHANIACLEFSKLYIGLPISNVLQAELQMYHILDFWSASGILNWHSFLNETFLLILFTPELTADETGRKNLWLNYNENLRVSFDSFS